MSSQQNLPDKDDMQPPVFDEVVEIALDGGTAQLVVHRMFTPDHGGLTAPIYWHSPLDATANVTCAICEGGARVRLG